MLIALLFALFMLPCLDARAVVENSLTETARCEYEGVCVITEGIARLLLQPLRTIRLITEAVGDFISSFSLKELLKAALGAVTVPLSLIIHTPEEIKFAIETISGHLFPAFKMILKDIEEELRNRPLDRIKRHLSTAVIVPLYTVFEGMEGVVVAVSQSGLPNYHKAYIQVKRMAQKVDRILEGLIWSFHCTKILSPSSCNKLYHVFESIVVNPAFKFINGLMALVQKVLDKVKDVVIPIVDRLSPSKLQAYCSKVLSEEYCARIFLHIREMDKFGEKEIRKVLVLVYHVLQWVFKHIFTDNVLSKEKLTKVINSF